MKNACELADWHTAESFRIYDHFAGQPLEGALTSGQQIVMGTLQRIGSAATKDELKRHSRPCKELDKDGRLELLLSELIKVNRITETFREHCGGGRTAVEYEIFTSPKPVQSTIQKNIGENRNSELDCRETSEKNVNSVVPLPAGHLSEFADCQNPVEDAGSINACEDTAEIPPPSEDVPATDESQDDCPF